MAVDRSNIRLSPEDRAVMDAIALRKGLDNRSALVRYLVYAEARREKIPVPTRIVARRGRPPKAK